MEKIYSSFRDPDGFVFKHNNRVYRAVTDSGKQNFENLINTGLYKELTNKRLLINHEVVNDARLREKTGEKFPLLKDSLYTLIKPEPVPFVSYSYEWCFSQLKSAALATLEIQRTALGYGMSLKDGSAFNIQFLNNDPVHIDTLSFEQYTENEPWAAYGQFCRHFLAPLALMKYRDLNLNKLLQVYLDGVPLNVSSRILPLKSRFSFGILLHIHLHSKADKTLKTKSSQSKKISKHSLLGIIDSLETAIEKINIKQSESEWTGYYNNLTYSKESFAHKKEIVSELLDKINVKTLWDIGANTGEFSRLAAEKGIATLSIDADPHTVERNYRESMKQNTGNILPLCIDICNPSPGLGWSQRERMPLMERAPADAVLALGIIHHLVTGNNLSFEMIAGFFGRICKNLIIEFVPKDDPGAKQLLRFRKDIFTDYSQKVFESAFSDLFSIKSQTPVKGTGRIIYLMQRKGL